MPEKTFLLDADKCTSCKLCVVACKDEHVDNAYPPYTRPQPMTGQFWVDIKAMERGAAPRLRMTYMPVFCQNCADAPCITACPEDAIKTRPDGLVWIDPALCTGCGDCQPACPYDVIFMNGDIGIAQKCTGCAHRVDEGLLPRCADACPHDAIRFGDAETLAAAAAAADTRPVEAWRPETGARPRALWKGLPRPWIAGTLVDTAAEEVVGDASITITDLADNRIVSARSDAFGDFWVRGLEAGRHYRLDIARDGYETASRTVTTDGDQDVGTIGLERAG